MKRAPLVSIITVVYNGEKYLEQTIGSVIGQTYSNIEYIIVDGGSTDGTLNIIKKNESYISKWVSEPDNGLYDAMNKGIGMANGELIGMINSDDWYELDTVEIIVKLFIKNPEIHIFHADRYNVMSNGKKTVRQFNSSLFKFKYYGMTYNHPSMFILKEEYRLHKYNTTFKSVSDYQFVLETLLRNPNVFYYIEKPLVNYRLDGISSRQGFFQGKIETYRARRLAGLTILECLFALLFGTFVNGAQAILKPFK